MCWNNPKMSINYQYEEGYPSPSCWQTFCFMFQVRMHNNFWEIATLVFRITHLLCLLYLVLLYLSLLNLSLSYYTRKIGLPYTNKIFVGFLSLCVLSCILLNSSCHVRPRTSLNIHRMDFVFYLKQFTKLSRCIIVQREKESGSV